MEDLTSVRISKILAEEVDAVLPKVAKAIGILKVSREQALHYIITEGIRTYQNTAAAK